MRRTEAGIRILPEAGELHCGAYTARGAVKPLLCIAATKSPNTRTNTPVPVFAYWHERKDPMKKDVLEVSNAFWDAMRHGDGAKMIELADPACEFVHIGANAGIQEEAKFYTDGIFKPTDITIRSQKVNLFGDTAVVITDCDYALLLDGKETSHHFVVTEVYIRRDDAWKLIQWSFTALVY